MIKTGIFGAGGRVGKLLIENLKNDSSLSLSTVFARNKIDFAVPSETLVTNQMEVFLDASELVIDFTLPEATEELLKVAIEKSPTPLVIGTTGLNSHQQNLLKQASEKMPVLYATNMSVGVALLNKLVFMASKTLKDFDIEITEMHHKFKKDAPSGTALTLADFAAKGRDLNIDSVRVSGRDGNIGQRKKDEIAVMALRGGDIVGEHTVGFYADGEFIRLNHTATNRNTFSNGAIRAGKWLVNQPNGLYSIQDFLQL
ncbi:MAG: 4-hydroxy-tetrahydrodipicolinate reductase [Campylobacterota bacterium]|nr:4-hydroxy-tetrahydrodipicolinate reductase [Campylobacterota bacterium]